MENFVSELIDCKMRLAESEDLYIQQSRNLKLKTEKISFLQNELQKLQVENSRLSESLQQLIEEKKTLQMKLEESIGLTFETNSSLEEERNPEMFLDLKKSVDETAWTKIVQKWDTFSLNRKVRIKFLIKKGIPPKLRGEIWSKKIGNSLCLNPQFFNLLVNKSNESESDERDKNGSSLIPLDLQRTLGNYQVFEKDQPLHQALNDLLQAFAAYRPDIGYIEGMAYLGAILVLHMNTYKAFECFSNLVFSSELILTFYSFDLEGMENYYKVFRYYMKKKVPHVLKKFEELGITPDIYLLEWIYTLYSRCFEFEVVAELWDTYFFEGDCYIFKVGLGILITLESWFKSEVADRIVPALTDCSEYITDSKKFFSTVDKVQISNTKIQALRIKFK